MECTVINNLLVIIIPLKHQCSQWSGTFWTQTPSVSVICPIWILGTTENYEMNIGTEWSTYTIWMCFPNEIFLMYFSLLMSNMYFGFSLIVSVDYLEHFGEKSKMGHCLHIHIHILQGIWETRTSLVIYQLIISSERIFAHFFCTGTPADSHHLRSAFFQFWESLRIKTFILSLCNCLSNILQFCSLSKFSIVLELGQN